MQSIGTNLGRAGRRTISARRLSATALVLASLIGTLSWSAATPTPVVADFQETRCLNWSGQAAYWFGSEAVGANDDTAPTRNNLGANLEAQGTAPDFLDLDIPSKGVLANDDNVQDANGNLFSNVEALLYEGPTRASSFVLHDNGSWSYVPRAGYTGPDQFRYVWARGGYCSNIATVTIPGTISPRLRDETYAAVSDETLEVGRVCGSVDRCGLLQNDLLVTGRQNRLFIPEDQWDDYGQFTHGDPWLTWPVTMATDHGSVTMRASGAFTYTPDAGFVGVDSFFYSSHGAPGTLPIAAHNVGQLQRAAKVTMNVAHRDTSIVAVADGPLEATEDTPLPIDPATLLANDHRGAVVAANSFDLNVNVLCAVGGYACWTGTFPSGRTAHGSLSTTWVATISAPPGVNVPSRLTQITYTPDPGFNGTDSFTYFASDTAEEFGATARFSLPVEVVIEVDPVADGITAVDDAGATLEERSVTIDALANDVDEDGDIDPSTLDHDPCDTTNCDRRHGTWTKNGDGTLTYTPRAEFSGQAIFPYVVRDASGNTSFAKVTVVVTADDAVDDAYATDEDTPLAVPAASGVLDNDDSPSSGAFEAVLGEQPAHGDVDLDPDGSFTYTPDGDFTGSDSFTYAASGDTATVTVDVDALNDAPVIGLNSACDPATLPPGGLCDTRYNLGDFDLRHTQESGDSVRLRGYLTDAELDGGTLVIDWGDSEQTSLDWPCEPFAEDCAFGQDRTHAVDCLLFPGVCNATAIWFDLTHPYADDPPSDAASFSISVSATDIPGAEGTADTTVRVANIDPTLTVAADCPTRDCIGASHLTVEEGETATIRGRVTDPGSDDGTLTIDWGDGSDPSQIQLGCETGQVCAAGPIVAERPCVGIQSGACGYWEATHVYGPPSVSQTAAEPAQYTIEATADDGDGGQGTASATAIVSPLLSDPPSATIISPADGTQYLLDEVVTADYACADDVSVISCTGTALDDQPVDTSTVGMHSFSVEATDADSQTGVAASTYSVVYDFAWIQPTDSTRRWPAGRTAAIKFSLAGDQGTGVVETALWQHVDCSTLSAIGSSQAAETGPVRYRAGSAVYALTVATSEDWGGTCRKLIVELDDGTRHEVVMRFR